MHAAGIILSERPSWQRKARPRLAASIALAVLLIAATIVLLRFEADVELRRELEVELLSSAAEAAPKPLAKSEPEPVPLEQPEESLMPVEAVGETPQLSEEPTPQRDWRAQIDEVAKAIVAEQQRAFSVNPAFDEKRRQAAVKFAPSRAPRKKPIWENVQTDQLGRKILVSGNCHRVIDDPSAVNYEIFRTFQQYIVYCTKQKVEPKELPWAEEIRNRHDYLARKDGAGDGDGANIFADLR